MKKLAFFSLPISVLLLAGCSATPDECDPSKELSFIQKMACTNSGSYEQRIDAKNSELRGELAHNATLSSELQIVRTEHQNVRRNVANKQNQVINVNSSINKVKSQTAAKQRTIVNANAEISSIKNKIAKLNAQPASDANMKELERLKALLIQREKEAAAAAGF